ncbi:hypothetical protein D1007_47029 [Hordeum vulgare]|nr:hypothetical protein D1007_47029 [Hordeum vulgare]
MGFRVSVDSLALIVVEQSLEQERQVSHAEESLASRDAELQESLDEEEKRRQVALHAQATAEGKLSQVCKQVKGVASLVGESSEEAVRARGLQLERSRMFQSLERTASYALSDICGESVSSPLFPDDARYLGFFLRIMERLDASAAKALALVEVKSRDLLSQAASDVFSHLLCLDPDFYFSAVLDPLLETTHATLDEWVEIHVEYLVARLAPERHGVDTGDDASP